MDRRISSVTTRFDRALPVRRRASAAARRLWSVCLWTLALSIAAACSSDPGGPDPGNGGNGPGNGGNGPGTGTLQIVVTGRVERGLEIQVEARRNQVALPAGQVSWSVQPAGAGVVLAGQRIRLTQAGNLTISATSGDDSESTTLNVPVPPSIVFDLLRNGNRDIYRVALDGQDLLRLTTHELEDSGPTAANGRVVFSGFRRFVVNQGQDTVAIQDLYSVPVGGGSETRLTSTGATERDAALSRNGQRLAFTRTEGAQVGTPKIWTANANGGSAARATQNFGFDGSPEVAPSWAPDNNRIVFVGTAYGNADLFILNTSNGSVTDLVRTSTPEVEPDWSPDGNWVVFTSERNNQVDIFRVRVADGHVEQLTNRAEDDYQPAYLPDGRIVYVAEVAGQRRLRWMDPANPSEVHDIDIGPGDPGHPAAIF